jgi:hypothetical protein
LFAVSVLEWAYEDVAGRAIEAGQTVSEEMGIPGDYNNNGVVDAADYTVWRDTLGSNENLSADGNANLMIDAGDYDVWVGHFGSVLGGAAVAAIDTAPEPSAIWLLALAGTAMAANGVRRRFSGRPAG